MPLVHIKNLLKDASRGEYALGAFNTQNLETTLAIMRAAEENRASLVIQVSEATIDYAGLESITEIMKTAAKKEMKLGRAALHLDHGKKFESIVNCIKAGFSSIMMDASHLPFRENIAITRRAAQYAHKHGVFAQGELGRLAGVEDVVRVAGHEAFMTHPDEAAEFVKKTGIDTLAVSVGNVHGIMKIRKGVPKLDLARLKEIGKKVKVPLVLHGASGIPKEEIKKAIKLGIRIINIDTEIRLAFTDSLRTTLSGDKSIFDPRKVLTPAMTAMEKVVAEKIKIFGSARK
ncbi:MAG: ketose-bisphosphate aldolase [Patescibacteria group bacterium]